jgi:hypothetical protein
VSDIRFEGSCDTMVWALDGSGSDGNGVGTLDQATRTDVPATVEALINEHALCSRERLRLFTGTADLYAPANHAACHQQIKRRTIAELVDVMRTGTREEQQEFLKKIEDEIFESLEAEARL